MANHTRHESTSTRHHLSALGLGRGASWEEIQRAYRSLVSDLTPGPDADHRNVGLALRMLREVKEAFESLSVQRVA
ncbi:MAG: hypothetical protein OES24_14565 [Acidimicrobiia bacterium]|nr:hypothetical protein [Acidimicrobiia bacterium]